MSGEHSTKSFSGRTQTAENLSKLIGTVTDKVKELASSGSVAGDKIYFEDSAVIPVSKVSAGFAGGAADILNFDKRSADGGAGAGAKITVTPMAFIVREEGKIRLVGMPEPEQNEGTSSGIVSSLIGAGMEALAEKKAKKNEKTDSEVTVTETESDGKTRRRKFKKSTETKEK